MQPPTIFPNLSRTAGRRLEGSWVARQAGNNPIGCYFNSACLRRLGDPLHILTFCCLCRIISHADPTRPSHIPATVYDCPASLLASKDIRSLGLNIRDWTWHEEYPHKKSGDREMSLQVSTYHLTLGTWRVHCGKHLAMSRKDVPRYPHKSSCLRSLFHPCYCRCSRHMSGRNGGE